MPTAELEGALACETMIATTTPLLIFSGISTWRSYHCGGAISRVVFIPLHGGEPNTLNSRVRVVRKAGNTVEMRFWTTKHDYARPDSFVPNISCVFRPRTGVSVFSPKEALSLSSPRGNRVPIRRSACPPVVCTSLFVLFLSAVCLCVFVGVLFHVLVCKRDSDPQALFDLTSSFL